MTQTEFPNPDSANAPLVLEYIHAFRRSKTMFVATSLGVFDELAPGPRTADQIASRLSLNLDAADRLLNACVSLGLLQKQGSSFSNTATAQAYLVSASPDSLAGYIVYSEHSLYPLWGHLHDAIREGTNRWEQTFGSRTALFDHFFRDEAAKRSFLTGMHGLGQLTSKAVVRVFDLARFRHLVDLGGATGHLAVAACEAYAPLRATVLDLPAVGDLARECIARSAVADRAAFQPGDFFTNDLPTADLYAIGRILHDWNPDRCIRLLTRIHLALPSEGALLIAETLLDDDHTGPRHALMQSLNMLVCTEGRERSCSEYREMCVAAGFHSVECRRTGTVLDAILAMK
jgi:acetylserotonin N-methyltransferase